MENKTKSFIMVVVGCLAFIQAGAWYMGFDGQVTVTITGIITYLVGIASKEGIDKILNK